MTEKQSDFFHWVTNTQRILVNSVNTFIINIYDLTKNN